MTYETSDEFEKMIESKCIQDEINEFKEKVKEMPRSWLEDKIKEMQCVTDPKEQYAAQRRIHFIKQELYMRRLNRVLWYGYYMKYLSGWNCIKSTIRLVGENVGSASV